MNLNNISPLNFRQSYLRVFLRYALIFLGVGLVSYAIFSEINNASHEEKTLWIIDASLSMVVQDIQGNANTLITRFDLAKQLALSGGTIFSGKQAIMTLGQGTRLILPFSENKEIFSATIQGLSPIIYNSLTDIESTIASARLIYGEYQPHIILLTDGEDTLRDEQSEKINSKDPISLTIIGIGTQGGGPMLQGYDANGNPRYKQYEGKNAISTLDVSHIEKMAKNFHSDALFLDSVTDVNAVLKSLSENTYYTSRTYTSLYVILGIVVMIVGLILSPVRYHG